LNRLVVVSNRVAVIKRARTGGEGGLAVAVMAAMRERGGLWFGWSGQVFDREPGPPDVFDHGPVTYALVDLTQQDYEQYYKGYANRTVWPLFHYRLDLTEFTRPYFIGYQRVNSLFASKLLPLLESSDVIWVHDYHLIPMAEQLRAGGCRQRIGFFLHIPWPSLDIFLALPNHREIVRALCAYDLVGFQTETDLRHFFEYIELEAGGEVDGDGRVEAFGRELRAGAFPISIDTRDVADFAEKAKGTAQYKRLEESLGGRQLMIGVDRLDYSKGLIQRMEAVEQLLQSYPGNRDQVITLQIAPQTRSDVPEYMDIRERLDSVVGRVNGTYADFDWMPIRYLTRGFNRRTLAGFLRASRVGLVTPLRDGMNLVAKEYIAAQDPKDPGVLVLSRFAGAAEELTEAILVNPHDIEGMADAMQTALHMPLKERRQRWSAMFDWLCEHDIVAWQKTFLDVLTAESDYLKAKPRRVAAN